MPRTSPDAVVLTDAQRGDLDRMVRAGRTEQRLALRAGIVLAAADGQSNTRIAASMGVCEDTARKWWRRWCVAPGVSCLGDAKRSGRPAVFSPVQVGRTVWPWGSSTRAACCTWAAARPGWPRCTTRSRERWSMPASSAPRSHVRQRRGRHPGRRVVHRLLPASALPASHRSSRPNCDGAETLPLTGEWVQAPGFNANGIAATANGRALIVMNTGQAAAYLVDPATGAARRIASDVPLTNGDGILLRGRELIVVQDQLNQLAVLRLSPDLSTATLRTTLKDGDFDVPTTVAAFGRSLYVVNAKFGTTPTPTTPYEIVKVEGE